MGLLSCNPDPTQTGKSLLQILHGTTRRSSTFAWLFVVRSDRRRAATFTQRLQNAESLSPLERWKDVHRQKLDVAFGPSKGRRP
jgi:hypothetical protein